MKKICWITATYFLDVDLPIVPKLEPYFDIDWFIITNASNKEQDEQYIESKNFKNYSLIVDKYPFFDIAEYKFLKEFIKRIRYNYDWYYFDISSLLYLFPLIKKYIGINNVTIATHNVKTPKGARLYWLAKINMRYIVDNFKFFQVFSMNQRNILSTHRPDANIFYCPLMLKDYGRKDTSLSKKSNTIINFLFFGNIVEYKRVDILILAAEELYNRGIRNFKVTIAGYCKPDIWNKKYKILIKNSDIFECDIRRIPNDLVSKYFERSDYFIMPYQDIAQSGAMTVAFNYNIPIIASNLDTFKEFITDNETGYFFQSLNYKSLSEVMEKAINNNISDYQNLQKNQQRFIDYSLSEKVIISRYVEYFNNRLNDQTCKK